MDVTGSDLESPDGPNMDDRSELPSAFTLKLIIDEKVMLKRPSESLNLARKVNNVYTNSFCGASWNPHDSLKTLYQVNHFQWTNDYAITLAGASDAGMSIEEVTLPKPIRLGQKVPFDEKSRLLLDPVAVGSGDGDGALLSKELRESIIVTSVPPNLRASVSCRQSIGSETWLVLYVDARAHVDFGDVQIRPSNDYALFWNENVVPATIIGSSMINNGTFKFQFSEGQSTMTLRWGYKKPNSPSSKNEVPTWYKVED